MHFEKDKTCRYEPKLSLYSCLVLMLYIFTHSGYRRDGDTLSSVNVICLSCRFTITVVTRLSARTHFDVESSDDRLYKRKSGKPTAGLPSRGGNFVVETCVEWKVGFYGISGFAYTPGSGKRNGRTLFAATS